MHSGMRDEADEVITKLKPLIDKTLLQYPNYSVVFTGHSLGAGAASIATLILQTSYPHINAYCFACPSCVSADLLPRLSSSVISVANMHDAVPRMNSSAMHKAYDAISNADWLQVATRFLPGISGGEYSVEGLKSAFEKLSSNDWGNRLLGCRSVDSVVELVKEGIRSIAKDCGKSCGEGKASESSVGKKRCDCVTSGHSDGNRNDKLSTVIGDQSNNVTNDMSNTITNDIPNIIPSDQSNNITSDQSNSIPSDQSNNITSDQSNNITSDQSNSIPSDQSNNITSDQSNNITSDQSNNIPSDQSNNITSDQSNNIPSDQSNNITNDQSNNITNDQSNNITSDQSNAITSDQLNTTHSLATLPSDAKSFSWTSFLSEYNTLNTSLSLAFNFMHAYNAFFEQEKRILDAYHTSVDSLLDTYCHNVKERGNLLRDRSAEQLDPSRVAPSVIGDQSNALEETSGAELVEYSAKQASLLVHYLASRTASLEGELKETRQQLLDSLQPLKKPLLPAIPSAAATAESFSDFLMVLKQVFSKKEEKGDWFPYPQLYPPGVILHIRNNPTMKNLDDYEVLEEAKKRLDGKTRDRVVSDTQLVEVDKEEFDHYSLESTLAEDHRMGNYVWGLIRVIDRKQFEETVNLLVCWNHYPVDVNVVSEREVQMEMTRDSKDAFVHLSSLVVLLCCRLLLSVVS